MKTKEQDDIQQPYKGVSRLAPVDQSKRQESNRFFGVPRLGKEKEDLTGRAYEYFHKLQ